MQQPNSDRCPDGDSLNTEKKWAVLGYVPDALSAGYARETLQSCEIPVVVFSLSGYFGQAGLNLPTIWKAGRGWFQIRVKVDDIIEAREIMDMILGQSWRQEP